jgi:ABC-type sulfate transport system permease component
MRSFTIPFVNAVMNIPAKIPSAIAAIIIMLLSLLRHKFRQANEEIITLKLNS